MEVRSITTDIEIRQDGDNNIIEGYAIVFNSLSDPLGWGFREIIMPDAVSDTLLEQDIRALLNHDPNFVLARNNKTLTLTKDDRGVKYSFAVPNTTAGRDAAENIKNGNITGSSFSFSDITEEWGIDEEKREIRTIKSIGRLYDVGPVVFPAYSETTAQKRDCMNALQGEFDRLIDIEILQHTI